MAKAAADPQIMAALTSFVGAIGGTDTTIRKGDLFLSDHEAVRRWPHLFRAVEVRRTEPVIEQATAAPGEKRGA